MLPRRKLNRLKQILFGGSVGLIGPALHQKTRITDNPWGKLYFVDINSVRSWGGRRITNNPFYQVLSECADRESSLRLYRETIRTLNLAEQLNNKVEKYGYPWELYQRSDRSKIRTLRKELAIQNPEVADLPSLEIDRLLGIHYSIRKKGFDFFLNRLSPIVGDFLLNNNAGVVLIRHGEHRVASLAALGLRCIPILLSTCRRYTPQDCATPQSPFSDIEIREVFKRIIRGEDLAPLYNIRGFFF